MKKKFVFGSLLVCLFASGMVFVSCNNDTEKVDPTDRILDALGLDRAQIREIGLDTSALEGAKPGDHILIWGGFEGSLEAADQVIQQEGWTATSLTKSRYSTTHAVAILNYCLNNLTYFQGGGSIDSAENLIAYEGGNPKEGAPDELKTAMTENIANVPIAGLFQNQAGAMVVFFVAKIK